MSDRTATYPYSAIVQITDVIGGVSYQGSGVLIAPDEVLTAAHVVYQSGVGTATNIEVSPGYASGATPYGTVAGVSFHYNALSDSNDEISNASSQSDFAVIHLAQPITQAGTMALEANDPGGQATVSGYPSSARGAQVDSAEMLTVDPSYTLYEAAPLGPGSSGGPVWVTAANGQADVVGLVSSGNSRIGYFVQLTTAVVSQIEAWVADDDGTASATSGFAQETVSGAGGATITLDVPLASAALAASLLAQVNAALAAGTLVAETVSAAGAAGVLFVSQSAAVSVPVADAAVIDDAAGASTVALNAGNNVSVVAAGGSLTLYAGNASGTLAGGSGGTVFSEAASGGAWDIGLGGGANTIVAAAASTVAAGAGQNLIYLGSGVSSVASTGTDTIIAGSGAATISAGAHPDLVFASQAALTFIAGSASSTVIGGKSSTTLVGGSGATLFFGSGSSSYLGGGGADTVVGGSGSLNGQGAGGALIMFGGSAGGNLLSSGDGPATLVGGGTGDILTATGTADVVLVAAGGAETLDSSDATGSNVFFGGSGSDFIAGGLGSNVIIAGSGNQTLNGGGDTVFVFVDGVGSGSDLVSGFNPRLDSVLLAGFSAGAIAATLNAQTAGRAGTQIILPDGLHVTFSGVASLSNSVVS